MALKKEKKGDPVSILGQKYVIQSARGTMLGYERIGSKMDFMTTYFEKEDLDKMHRIKVSDLPKALAERTKSWRKSK